ncbi:formate dehydrogenase accessory sulfurtransferase FdhD [Streptacidiphilus sp. ASG 303]|uniref:formate dehydrogenase accessory sulfurtransferase FdhD n=1 Tax=Streptomycetaceae TaxID=2062 RepID=UPI001E3FB88D|nr:formate dehydrogenase accessory sulfurtransferase FdhD [Streptacidiphilus sp. ASG 303]MCD0481823.1 formate dehydrogenase accessory sulfurtransferase FdhD [Streptacidiphilus sp. ASG 303]
MGRVTERRRVVRLRDGASSVRPDSLAAEEPLEIRIGGQPLTVTMRTPGHDFDLVAGFLVSEGLLHSADRLAALRYCAGTDADGANTYNVVDAAVRGAAEIPVSLHRNLLTSSACGICGRDTVDAVRTRSHWDVAADPVRLDPEVLYALPDRLRAAQKVFDTTGGLHAAGLFTADGELRCVREDVGRHNAVDKVVGWALREGLLPLSGHVLMVSGRASFELTQKAAMAGIPVLAAVSAPSGLAVDLAAELGLTLVGFLRGRSANLYAGAERVTGAPAG